MVALSTLKGKNMKEITLILSNLERVANVGTQMCGARAEWGNMTNNLHL